MDRHFEGSLEQLQSLDLESKIMMTISRIKAFRMWANENMGYDVYVSFSGGKDSTVLRDIINKNFANIDSVFINTGLELTSIQRFVRSKAVVCRPEMNFSEVVQKFGYPVISKEVAKTVYFANKQQKWAIEKITMTGRFKGYRLNDFTRYQFLLDAPFKVSSFCCDCLKKKTMKDYNKKNKDISSDSNAHGRKPDEESPMGEIRL